MGTTNFIKLTLKDYIIVHGYDDNNKEVEEKVPVENYSEKVISKSRIKSLTVIMH